MIKSNDAEHLQSPLKYPLQPDGFFRDAARKEFASNYPETPHQLSHTLRNHPLLTLESLSQLAESLPSSSIEYNAADQPIGVTGKPAPTGIPIGETIRDIETTRSWAVLKNIEQDARYAALINTLLSEIRPAIEAKTGPMHKTQGFIFVTSAGGVTPYHFDPEHNVLLQVRGFKVMTQFIAGDPKYAPDRVHETYHTGGGRELEWNDDLQSGGVEYSLAAGDAVYVPVMAPHFVRNGPEPSISLSITWRSGWSFAEADARAFNNVLRKLGLTPKAPSRWPKQNHVKAWIWRIIRKFNLA